MLDFAIGTQIYLAPGITDLRKSFNGLAAIVKLRFKLDPYSKCMFAFCNRNRNLIKILQWDGSGLWLFMKRLDKGNFRWPTNASEVKRISIKELRWLLEGLSIEHRGGYHPKKYLSEYSGYLTTDGYQAYHALDSRIVVSGCFSHARRKFDECLKSVPEKDRKGTTADEAIKRIGLLYKIEALLKDKSPEKRYEEQLKQSKPVLDAYFQQLHSMSNAINSGSMIGKAVNYSLNQQQYLERYLLDGSLSIDNNAAERSIRIFATGRKNWEFCNTPNGAKASAIIYSITETAKANGLQPYDYLVHVLENIPKHYMGTSRDFLLDLMPWSDKIPQSCKSKKNAMNN